MTANHDRDIEIASELSMLSTSFKSLEKKIDLIAYDMKLYLQSNTENHSNMWTHINELGRSISWLKGIGLGLQVIWAAIIAWIELSK